MKENEAAKSATFSSSKLVIECKLHLIESRLRKHGSSHDTETKTLAALREGARWDFKFESGVISWMVRKLKHWRTEVQMLGEECYWIYCLKSSIFPQRPIYRKSKDRNQKEKMATKMFKSGIITWRVKPWNEHASKSYSHSNQNKGHSWSEILASKIPNVGRRL